MAGPVRTPANRSHAASAAATWDRAGARYGGQERLELRAIDAALALAAPTAADCLVDLATGTGLLLRRLAALPGRPAQAVGIDRSARMLARVGALPAGWLVLRGDARSVPLPDAHADVVTCAYLLHLLDADERRGVLGEACRLLRRDRRARLVVVTVWVDERRALGRGIAHGLRAAARMSPRKWGGLQPLDPTADLEAIGFTVTHRVVLPRGGYPSLVLASTPSFRGS